MNGNSQEFTITLPMGCACVDVDFGSYSNQVELPTPPHMLAFSNVGCISFRPTTCVDRCIAPLVESLWAHGVVTLGSCCGHNKLPGMVNIWQPRSFDAECRTHQANTGATNA